MGVLAQKKLWQNKRKAEGKPYDKPNMIMNSAVQVCWEVCSPIAEPFRASKREKHTDCTQKACRYFDIEERYVYCTTERYVMDPKECIDLIDENTIGICTYYSIYERTVS